MGGVAAKPKQEAPKQEAKSEQEAKPKQEPEANKEAKPKQKVKKEEKATRRAQAKCPGLIFEIAFHEVDIQESNNATRKLEKQRSTDTQDRKAQMNAVHDVLEPRSTRATQVREFSSLRLTPSEHSGHGW